MFGKISEKTRRQAYLNALAQDKTKQNNAVSFVEEKPERIVRKPQNNEKREVVSGKDAINLANREIKISGASNKKAIIKNKTADMKYYKDWRKRLGEIQEDLDEEQLVPRRDFDFDDEPELGKEEDLENKRRSPRLTSKELLDRSLPSNTKEEDNDDDFSFLDELFARRPKPSKSNLNENASSVYASEITETKKEDNAEGERNSIVDRTSNYSHNIEQTTERKTSLDSIIDDYSLEDFEDDTSMDSSFDEIASNASKINISDDETMNKKPAYRAGVSNINVSGSVNKKPANASKSPRKKKKKFDADIIGSTGFFTIR